MNNRFRLLPVLIFIAMLAFSVRLAEIITGISNFSGAAHAEAGKPDSEAKDKTEADKPDTAKDENIKQKDVAEKKDDTAKPDKESGDMAEEKPVEEAPKWRDAGDSDLDVSSVKMEVMEDLSKRSEQLDAQEKNLKAREALLKVTEKELDRKLQELVKMKTEIEGLLGKQTDEEQRRIISLVKIYEGMKPAEAARIFNTLDLDVLVAVVGKMSERKISPILGMMEAERAKTLTIMLAEQKQLPSLEQPQ